MSKIGFFDSGVGGLTVLNAAINKIAGFTFYYLGDTKHCPYGDRPLPEVRQLALNAVEFLTLQNCTDIVMACNISSSIALKPAREEFPKTRFHGLINDDLVKKVRSVTQNGRIGVMATTGTVNSRFYPETLQPAGLEVIQQACSPLVPMIEAGHHDGPLIRQTLEPLLAPLQRQDVDTIILGCTHYPFLSPVIRDLLDPNVTLVDPGVVMGRRLSQSYSGNSRDRVNGQFAATGEINSLKNTLEKDMDYENVNIESVNPEEANTP